VVGIDWPYLATWLPMVRARWDGETALSAGPAIVIRMSALRTPHSETIRLQAKLLNRQLCGTSGL
jgi:hypothetical protein